jgi:riboflavin kinase/FMN adenylyltransferase
MTFFPHPKQIIENDQTPQTYISFRAKSKTMQDLGVDTLIVLNIVSAFAHLSLSDFIEDYLCGFKNANMPWLNSISAMGIKGKGIRKR